MNSLFPSASSFRSRKEWENACWGKLVKLPEILKFIITATERHGLVMRAVACDRLRIKIPSRDITKELNISRQTLSTIQKATGENNYQSYRQRGKTERKKKSYGNDKKVPHKIIHIGKRVKTK